MAAYALVVRPRGIKSAGAADRAAAAVRAAELELATARSLVEGKGRADEELNAFYQNVLPVDLSAARRMTYASLPARATQDERAVRTAPLAIAPLGHVPSCLYKLEA